MTSLEITNVEKFYGSFKALHGISLSIRKGEFVTLLGPSGSGKTTLLKILAGFEPVSQGTITLQGRDITTLPPEKRDFGLVFQGYALFPHMSVYDNIAYPLKVRRQTRAEVDERVRAMLALVQLEKYANRRPQELSGGQQQRVALARALAFQPEVLLLDEPMSALDKKLRHDLQDELRDIHRQLGTTFINVTHDQEEAMHMSDRIAIMDQGHIRQYDTAHRLYRHPASRFVAEFVGKSNFFEGRISAQGPRKLFSTATFDTALASDQPQADTFMLRPEDAQISGERAGSGQISLPATIASSTYSGDRAYYTVTLSDGSPFAVWGKARSGIFADGSAVRINFSAEDLVAIH